MATLGGIQFAGGTAPHDSAAAFLLSSPAEVESLMPCAAGEVEVKPGRGYVVARFNRADDAETALRHGLAIAQAGLDLMSITGVCDLTTQRAFEESVVSWRSAGEQVIQIRSRTTLSFTVSPVRLIVRDAAGNDVTRAPSIPAHHPAFRYFRLSQTSDDLYDAYRNMYLCFELLLSSRVPLQPGERERDWLARGLSAADADLNLGRFFPASPTNVPDAAIAALYTDTRLPLFHAKAGRHVLPPHESEDDRRAVTSALDLLTGIVLAMAETWFGARRLGGGVFTGWIYQNLRKMYAASRILALRDSQPFVASQRDLSAKRYADAVPFHSEVRNDHDDPRVPVLWGEVPVSSLWQGELSKIEVVGPDTPMLGHMLADPLSLDDFSSLQYYDSSGVENVRHPKHRFKQ